MSEFLRLSVYFKINCLILFYSFQDFFLYDSNKTLEINESAAESWLSEFIFPLKSLGSSLLLKFFKLKENSQKSEKMLIIIVVCKKNL